MGFYYLNYVSLLFLTMIYAIAITIFWFVWVKGLCKAFSGPLVWAVVAAMLIAPWLEEFWIAYHFGRACKEAGTFVYKRVKVEGFYDDTHGWRADKLQSSGYEFVEGRDDTSDPNSYWRHERVGNQIRSLRIDHPTARYHYKWESRYGIPAAHNVVKTEAVVIDTETNEQIARYTSFGRSPPWFWIDLNIPDFACDAPGRWPLTKGSMLVYRDVLIPAGKREEPK